MQSGHSSALLNVNLTLQFLECTITTSSIISPQISTSVTPPPARMVGLVLIWSTGIHASVSQDTQEPGVKPVSIA